MQEVSQEGILPPVPSSFVPPYELWASFDAGRHHPADPLPSTASIALRTLETVVAPEPEPVFSVASISETNFFEYLDGRRETQGPDVQTLFNPQTGHLAYLGSDDDGINHGSFQPDNWRCWSSGCGASAVVDGSWRYLSVRGSDMDTEAPLPDALTYYEWPSPVSGVPVRLQGFTDSNSIRTGTERPEFGRGVMAVPEPNSAMIFLLGVAGIYRRRQRFSEVFRDRLDCTR